MSSLKFESGVRVLVTWMIPAYGLVTSASLYCLGSTPKAYYALRSILDDDNPLSFCNLFMISHIVVTMVSFVLARLRMRTYCRDEGHILNTTVIILHFAECSILLGMASLIEINDMTSQRSHLRKMVPS